MAVHLLDEVHLIPVDLRFSIVSQWSDFVAEWCLGVEPAQSPAEVEHAFDALRRLWPESLDRLQAQSTRGLSSVVGTIDSGLTLAACESLSGFGSVMSRLRRGEASALAELEFAQALIRCGYMPVLEPRLGSKILDCSVGIGAERVFAEVISPEQAAEIRDAQATVHRLASEIVERNRGTRSEILLTTDADAQFDAIVVAVASAPPDGSTRNVEGIGWVRRDFLGPQPPNVGPLIYNPDPRPAVAVGTMRSDEDGLFTSVTVRLPITDERAHRLFSNELSHFSPEERNILVVRVGNVPGGMKGWRALASRWLQPNRNRRVGAVILYERAQVATQHPAVISQRWQVIQNPYAYKPVPRALINAISALDESEAWGAV